MGVSVAREYTKAVRNQTQWWGTFPIGLPMAVGDIIQLEDDGRLIKVGSVLDRPGLRQAFPVETRELTAGERYSWHATTSRAASGEGGASAPGGAEASASATLSFSSVGAFVLAYMAGKQHMFRDVEKTRRYVVASMSNNQWELGYALITEVIEADPATVVVSAEQNTAFQLKAKAALPFDASSLTIADPKFGFSGETTEGSVHESLARKSFPLYHCIRIRRNLLRQVYARLEGAAEADVSEVFTDSPFDDDDV